MAKEKTTKMTFVQMKDLNGAWRRMVAANDNLTSTKFGYAVKKFLDKNVIPLFTEYNELIAGARIEYALENPVTKAVLVSKDSDRGFEYSRDGLKAVIKAENALEKEWDAKEFTVEPYFATDVPKMSSSEKELFKGFVIE